MRTHRLAWPLIVFTVVAVFAAACSSDPSPTSSGSSGTGGYDYGSASSGGSGSPSSSDGGGRYGSGGDGGTSSGSGKTVMVGSEQANFEGAKNVSAAKSVDIEASTDGDTNYFSPTVLTGKPGETITVKLTNESSSVPHNFTVDGTDVNVDLDPGATQTVDVTFPTSGSLTFFCEYHRAIGMLGELKVG